ncbi:MAG TPA: 50S ribosomal protein L18e [Candidatus Caldiarchaeum subterraneum]|uniref:Large ribosomal subunit protein eL18 n=1 Tax=Caldiarchaeum subterraneum TaxID=311458 RepID=A0A832ZTX5_CALS0|nr:50S ribosomal protein L18e [Aigarchaeota archaeon]HIQ28930.1 50S ribosomal protein L18e [Candidatus Caldarchaeum subterraneum]
MPRNRPSQLRLRLVRKIRPYAKESRFWRRITEELRRSIRSKREVNVYKISRLTKAGDVVFVPGKVLGTGFISHPVTVGAFSFSKQAYNKITRAGGEALLLEEFMQRYPKGSNVRIIG